MSSVSAFHHQVVHGEVSVREDIFHLFMNSCHDRKRNQNRVQFAGLLRDGLGQLCLKLKLVGVYISVHPGVIIRGSTV